MKNEPQRDYPDESKKVIETIQKNLQWVKELVEMRDERLEGLSCFLIQKSEENDEFAIVYYPALTDGQRVSKYMDKSWDNMRVLIQDSFSMDLRCGAQVNENNNTR